MRIIFVYLDIRMQLIVVCLYIRPPLLSACMDHHNLPEFWPPLFRQCNGWSALRRGKSTFCSKLRHVQGDYCPLCVHVYKLLYVSMCMPKERNILSAKTMLKPVYLCVCVFMNQYQILVAKIYCQIS